MRPDRPKTDPGDLYSKPGWDRDSQTGLKVVHVTFRRRNDDNSAWFKFASICIISWLRIDELNGFYWHLRLKTKKPNTKFLSIWRKMTHTVKCNVPLFPQPDYLVEVVTSSFVQGISCYKNKSDKTFLCNWVWVYREKHSLFALPMYFFNFSLVNWPRRTIFVKANRWGWNDKTSKSSLSYPSRYQYSVSLISAF
jgi:hypothetical protein